MLDFLSNLFNTEGFPARWNCGVWTTGHGWLHILSDVAIFGAYTAIPIVLGYFVLKRRDLPFPRVMWLFVAFIFACGFGHLIEAVIFWHPVYRFDGVVKLFTAIVSWGTVFALVQIVPGVLHFPGLAKLNDELRSEIEERERIAVALRQSEGKLEDLLTSERQARSEAERANRIKDEFLSNVSHELRTPLNAILGYAQLLFMESKNSSEHEGLAVIERNARVQSQIIEDLLDMSRIMSGKVRLELETVNITSIIEAAVDTVRPTAEAKKIRLKTVFDHQDAPVLGDSARLQQVVWNLLANAVKFTPKEGKVEVSMRRVNSHLEIRVVDTGAGIDPEFLPHVFDRFRQADSATTRQSGGLGLGLSIVKQLVDLHGGTVAAASDGVGRGSVFTVCLPVRVMHGEEAPPPLVGADGHARTVGGPSLAGVRVLVVDDEADSRTLVARLLEGSQAKVAAAGSVDEAIAAFGKSPPDILLSDIGMPVKDGYDLIREIRMLPPEQGGRAPAVALTAFARSEDRKRAMLAGYQAHVTKPVDAGELVAVIAALTGRTGGGPDQKKP